MIEHHSWLWNNMLINGRTGLSFLSFVWKTEKNSIIQLLALLHCDFQMKFKSPIFQSRPKIIIDNEAVKTVEPARTDFL